MAIPLALRKGGGHAAWPLYLFIREIRTGTDRSAFETTPEDTVADRSRIRLRALR